MTENSSQPKMPALLAATETSKIIQSTQEDIDLIMNNALEQVQSRILSMQIDLGTLLSSALDSPVMPLDNGIVSSMDIVNRVAVVSGVLPELILGNSRRSAIVVARHIAMYLIYNYTQASFTSVGRVFKKDHTTVISARDKVKKQIEEGGKEAEIVTKVVIGLRLKLIIKPPNPGRGKPMSETGKRNVQFGAQKARDSKLYWHS